MTAYKLICMAFDGEYKIEHPEFKTIEDAWDYSNDLGSKWFFYPFHFVVSASGQTVVDSPFPLEVLAGRRVKTVSRLFKQLASLPETQGMDAEQFVFFVEGRV